MDQEKYRTEEDSLGKVRVPEAAYWGAQTQRAIENFPPGSLTTSVDLVRSIGMIKWAAALANKETGRLGKEICQAVVAAAREVMDGKLDAHFVVGIFQTGSGTSSNMNANEVIANRANEMLGHGRGRKHPVHPNDHVNLGQSSNDVFPSAIHITAVEMIETRLEPALQTLRDEFLDKASEFDEVVKTGRTHLQDAAPVRLGQEFAGYAAMLGHGMKRVRAAMDALYELALGGTAVGTGIGASRSFVEHVITQINRQTGRVFHEAENHFAAQGARGALVEMSGALKTLAVDLTKIANDIRWLGSGPRAGIGELILPAVQPGSSIMPGKVNPVLPEIVIQVGAQVIGNDSIISIGGQGGNFELNTMMPVMAHALFQSISLLSAAARLFSEKCVSGLRADARRCLEMVERSLSLATALVPHIGYDLAAEIAQEAGESNQTIREVVIRRGLLGGCDLDDILDPEKMTGYRDE